MRRIVLLSTLTPGRCFTLSDPPATFEEDDQAERVTNGRSILTADVAWKIVTIDAAGAACENAVGEAGTFEGSTKVVELPRQGWDRLAARMRGEA